MALGAVEWILDAENRKVYVFHLVEGSLPSHLKASLLEEQQRGAEIWHYVDKRKSYSHRQKQAAIARNMH
ncbi:hypothetical protein E2562_036303 [Oryza meyeriana var. granulata]|uniref:Uncharacterized protein n=1 Tax=Oryza meyeriana var. granulata TaxID=110450 RepID=A0A6G1FG02_9ORYZ|nr:hypothetical protein E2562_036303 [Oryza meyeriana var. granulata]